MSSINSPVLVADCSRPFIKRGVVRVVWQQDGSWLLTEAQSNELRARLLPTSWINPWGMHLRWQLESGGHRNVMLWRWQMSQQQWHRWRQRLVLQAGRSFGTAGEGGLQS